MTDKKGLDFEAVRRLAFIEVFKEIELKERIMRASRGLRLKTYTLDEKELEKLKKKFGVD